VLEAYLEVKLKSLHYNYVFNYIILVRGWLSLRAIFYTQLYTYILLYTASN